MMIDWQELKFKLREKRTEMGIMFMYLLKEPFLEVSRVAQGYYNSMLLFWVTVTLYIYAWKRNIGDYRLKIIIALIIISYIYMFFKSGRWKEYYQKEYVEGKKL